MEAVQGRSPPIVSADGEVVQLSNELGSVDTTENHVRLVDVAGCFGEVAAQTETNDRLFHDFLVDQLVEKTG